MGSSFGKSSVSIGGSRGVVAWPGSSSCSSGFDSMPISPPSKSNEVSLESGTTGDEGSRLSWCEMALKAGLRICDELRDAEREAGELT